MNIFLNANHDLRSGWKLLAYAITFVAVWVASGVALSLVYSRSDLPDDPLTLIALNEAALLVAAVAAVLLMSRFVDHRPLKAFGIGFLPGWQRDALEGLALAATMIGVVIAGCYALGYVSMAWTAGQASVLRLLATLTVLLVAAAVEELMFRGFTLQVLSEGIGDKAAVLVLSVVFGLMHMNNPNASPLGTLNTIVAGVLLSIAYVKTRSLWMSYAIHVGWNVGLGFIFGFPLSGLDLASLWTTGIAGSDTLLGGGYGPEGGLLATFIFGVSALTVQRRKQN